MVVRLTPILLPFNLMFSLEACGPTIQRGIVTRIQRTRSRRLGDRGFLGLLITRRARVIPAPWLAPVNRTNAWARYSQLPLQIARG